MRRVFDPTFSRLGRFLGLPFMSRGSLIVALARRGRIKRREALGYLEKLAEYISEGQYAEARAASEAGRP